MPTNNSFNNQIAAAYNQIILNAGTNGVAISTDASAATINVATGSAIKTTTVGSTNSTSATTVQSGSGALNITATNGALTIISGTGTMAIGNDATAQTIGFATGAGAKVATVGSTNGASSLGLRYGTADFTLASATGTVMSALDTGEITYPLQPAFLAFLASTDSNVTGNGAAYTLGTNVALTEIFDQNGDFNTNGTFTAPVTGRYTLGGVVDITGCTIGTGGQFNIVTSNRTCRFQLSRVASNLDIPYTLTSLLDMDAADTCTFNVVSNGEAGNTQDIQASATNINTGVWGNLTC